MAKPVAKPHSPSVDRAMEIAVQGRAPKAHSPRRKNVVAVDVTSSRKGGVAKEDTSSRGVCQPASNPSPPTPVASQSIDWRCLYHLHLPHQTSGQIHVNWSLLFEDASQMGKQGFP